MCVHKGVAREPNGVGEHDNGTIIMGNDKGEMPLGFIFLMLIAEFDPPVGSGTCFLFIPGT